MKVLVNLTPHDVTIFGWEEDITIPASGEVARLSHRCETVEQINGIPVTRTVFGEVEGLPEPADGVVYIVSSLVANRVPERDDVVFPSGAVRDERGIIVGCRSLGKV